MMLFHSIETYFTDVAPYAPILQRQDLQPTQLPNGSFEWPITIYGIVVSTLRVRPVSAWHPSSSVRT